MDEVSLSYSPSIVARGAVRFYDGRRGIDEVRPFNYIAAEPDDFGRVPWSGAIDVDQMDRKLMDEPDHPDGVSIHFHNVPDSMNDSKAWKGIEDNLEDYLYAEKRLILKEHPRLKITQAPGEDASSFHQRLQSAIKEERDEELDKIEDRFEAKMDKIEDRIRKEERDLSEAEAEQSSRKTAEWVNAAETLFSVFVKGRSRSFGTAATKSVWLERQQKK